MATKIGVTDTIKTIMREIVKYYKTFDSIDKMNQLRRQQLFRLYSKEKPQKKMTGRGGDTSIELFKAIGKIKAKRNCLLTESLQNCTKHTEALLMTFGGAKTIKIFPQGSNRFLNENNES